MKRSIILVLLLSVVLCYPEEDLVSELEQMPDIGFGLYSGYLPINGTSKSLHYVAALSQNNPKDDPVVFWFNGGPGCSSLLGFTQEHGPYVIGDFDTQFHKNKFSWNMEVTMVYLEFPAGVGFSTCENQTECKFTDNSTADDNLIAILNFFEMKFPELKDNHLYISGESYAGIYIPYLAYRIDSWIQKHKHDKSVFKPNLIGLIIGNGVTNFQWDCIPAFLEMSHYNGMIEEELYKHLKDNCNYTDFMVKYSFSQNLKEGVANNATCDAYFDQWMNTLDKLNIYDIYGKCYQEQSEFELYASGDYQWKFLDDSVATQRQQRNTFSSREYTSWMYPQRNQFRKLGKGLPSCDQGLPAQAYLNDPVVRTQLHIPKNVQEWELCASQLSYTQEFRGAIWAYEQLKGKYRILKYSGDTDGAVPTLGTQKWIYELGWKVLERWRPYFYDGQLAGYVEERESITFGSIHGAGHMAPMLKSAQTYHLIFNWLFKQRI